MYAAAAATMAGLSREAISQTAPVASKRKSTDGSTENGPRESSTRQKVDSRRDRGRSESERAGRSEKRSLGRSQYKYGHRYPNTLQV